MKEIQHGRWNIKETAERILDTAIDHEVTVVGIEAGSLKNALMPYLSDLMRVRGQWIVIQDVTHGGKKKTDRITWALQGRLEHGKIRFNYGFWNRDFINQMMDFPNSRSHDDLLDALAYIDQVSVADFVNDIEIDDWEPLDATAGY